MIPVRVAMKGFLSYAEEQVISFDGAGLWILEGPNGSGKSAVFDALTYALFASHRGGSGNTETLIHTGLDAMSVEFDFTLGSKLYRIQRSLKKNKKGDTKPAQQAFVYDGETWQAEPNTNKKSGLDDWVERLVGLTYETFTSSVLLLQGKAEKLLDGKPAERAEVLAGVVDLAKFKKLNEAAVDTRKLLEKEEDRFQATLDTFANVTPEALSEARVKEHLAQEKSDTARTTIEQFSERERRARLWADAHARHTAAVQALQQAEKLVAGAPQIEKDYARWDELRTVLPQVQQVILEKSRVWESEKKTERFLKEREEEQKRKDVASKQEELARIKKLTARESLVKDEAKYAVVTAQFRERTAILEQVKQAEQAEAALLEAKASLAKLPKDAGEKAAAAREEVQKLRDLKSIIPTLDRIRTERDESTVAETAWAEANKALEDCKHQGEEAKAELAVVDSIFKQCEQTRAVLQTDAAAKEALRAQGVELAAEFETLKGEANCRACGQALTPAHYEEEKARRKAEVQATTKAAEEAKTKLKDATTAEATARAAVEKQTVLLQQLREKYQATQGEIARLKKDNERHKNYLQLALKELPEPYRTKVLQENYPSKDQVQLLQSETDRLVLAEHAMRDAEKVKDQHTRLMTEVQTHAATYTRVVKGLPTDTAAIRREHEELRTTEVALGHAVRACKLTAENAEREEDKHRQVAHSTSVNLTSLAGKLMHEETLRAQCREHIERTASRLNADWQLKLEHAGMAQEHTWQTEFSELVTQGIEQKRKELERARGGLVTLTSQVAREADALSTFTESERVAPDLVRQQLAEARAAATVAETEYLAAKQTRTKLETDAAKLAKLQGEQKALLQKKATWDSVVKYTGRDHLQRYLVRTAEKQIIDHANAVLDKLSMGELTMQEVSTENTTTAEKAFDLEVINRTTGTRPLPVAFLSGSQKFRVAVSLALGIGRYASRQHRPIESVIIDEGFGCLDQEGIQTINQELDALRGALDRVILVSHQPEIAKNIPHGYHFERINGATKVSRRVEA